MPGHKRETRSDDSFQYFGEGFEQDNDPKGGRCIVGCLARLIQYDAI